MEYEAKNAAITMMVFLCVFIPLGLLTIFFFIKWIKRIHKKEREKEMEIYYKEVERRRQQAYQSLLEEQHQKDVAEKVLLRPQHLSLHNPNNLGGASNSSSIEYLVPTPFVEEKPLNIQRDSKISIASSSQDYLVPTPVQENKTLSNVSNENNEINQNPINSYTPTFEPTSISLKDFLTSNPSNPPPSANPDVAIIPNKTFTNGSQLSISDKNFPHKYESDLHNKSPNRFLGNKNSLVRDEGLENPILENPKIQIEVDSNSGDAEKEASVLLQSDL